MDITGIDYLGIDRVLRRGTGEMIEESGDALFVRDSVSGAYLLACADTERSLEILDAHSRRGYGLLMVSDTEAGREACAKYGFSGKLECRQTAYYGKRPDTDGPLKTRTADEGDLGFLLGIYHLISPDELRQVVARRSVLIGYDGEEPVGFIGEHLEGSMGLLYVLPEHRRRGYAAQLERIYIAKTMDGGFVPFGQVERENAASVELQKKLGMTVSENITVWMWK